MNWVAITALLSLAACSNLPPASRPAATAVQPIPIVYFPLAAPAPLKPAQLTEITTAAEGFRPHGRDIWFVAVRINIPERKRPHYRAIVYFSPDEQSPRLRKGRCLYLDNQDGTPATSGFDRGMRSYVQVSAAKTPFGPQLQTPELTLLPFFQPQELPDADLIGVVDFIRSFGRNPLIAPKKNTDPDNIVLRSLPDHIDPDSPILWIVAHDDFIEVTLGWQVASLYGRGTKVWLQRKGNGYEVLNIFEWVS
ncbi:MAG: hypothetical protein WCI73_02660 [Phycisphaerae bacterium]